MFAKDKGGDEFCAAVLVRPAQTRATTLLTDGKRSQNGGRVFSRDGGLLAYGSTARNGTDRDVWVRDTAHRRRRARWSTAGGNWSAMDFSPDGKRLLVMKYVSAAESYPGVVDVATGKLELFPVDGGKAAFGGFAFAPDGKAVYFVSDEPLRRQGAGIPTLRHHDPASGKFEVLSAHIPWDVDSLNIAEDGKHLAYVTNEDGISKLHVLSLPAHREVRAAGTADRRDRRLGVLARRQAPGADAQQRDLAQRCLRGRPGRREARRAGRRAKSAAWMPAKFVAPTLVRYPTFDQVDGKPRTIPAFYYRPANVPTGKKLPVVINIHGGPEAPGAADLQPDRAVPRQRTRRGDAGAERARLVRLRQDLPVARQRGEARGFGQGHRRAARLDRASSPNSMPRASACSGGSYGGYMVLASLMHYSDRIRAGVDIVGISHFGTFLEQHRELPPRPAPRRVRRRTRRRR